jgi:hypothetical protein
MVIYGKLDELFEITNISMLKSLKTIMGHKVGFIMMNLCNISKKIVSEVE